MKKDIYPDSKTAYQKSIELLRNCSSKYGFLASLSSLTNYRRVWSRDGVICGLAALLSREKDLIKTFEHTLDTLAQFQGRHGQIPSNIEPLYKYISFGRTAGRVDATLWYIIGCGQYFKYTKNKKFLRIHKETLKRAVNVLASWEFNEKDFIFVPESGDWADELPRAGYVLYDQLLYYQALKDYLNLSQEWGEKSNYWQEKCKRLKHKIITNYWIDKSKVNKKYVYHPELFERYYKKYRGQQAFWLENFNPHAFYIRFDAFANILTLLLDIADKKQSQRVVKYISGIIGAGYLVPAFYPVITAKNRKRWLELAGNYSFYFKNKPYCSHNGGLWPLLTGFYVAALVKLKKKRLAYNYFNNLNLANSLDKKKKGWGFYEYHHGLRRTPEGVRGLAWNAAAGIIAAQTLKGKEIFI